MTYHFDHKTNLKPFNLQFGQKTKNFTSKRLVKTWTMVFSWNLNYLTGYSTTVVENCWSAHRAFSYLWVSVGTICTKKNIHFLSTIKGVSNLVDYISGGILILYNLTPKENRKSEIYVHCCINCPQILREKTSSQNSQGIALRIQWHFFHHY